MSFTAQQQEIDKLFNKKVYMIPRNQRRYVWKSENWEDLKDDLEFVINSKSDKRVDHFIGSIVLIKDSTSQYIDKFIIIDGQQRTFTIMLIIASIIQIFKERELNNCFLGLCERVVPKDISNQPKCSIISDYYLSIEGIIKDICDWGKKDNISTLFTRLGLEREKHKNLEECLMYFYKYLKDKSLDYIYEFRDALLRTNYVEIVASTEEDSYTIFEILNARGQKLEDHELVKNYIMRYIHPKEKVDSVKARWSEFIENQLGSSISKYFQHYIKHRYAVSDDQKNIYTLIKHNVGTENVETFFNDILRKVSYYKCFLNPTTSSYSKLTDVERRIFSFFNKRKAIQFRPLLMSLMHQKEEGKLAQGKYEETLNQIYIFWVCYNIIGEQKSNKLEDVIRKYAPLIENQYSDTLLEELLISLKKKLPGRIDFINAFHSLGWSNKVEFFKDSKMKLRVQLVLELIENYNKGSKDKFTIEHILPDSSNCNDNAYIGNLLPLEESINNNLKDKGLEEKIKAYEKSNFSSTRQFAERYKDKVNTFNPKKRTEFLGKLIYDSILNIRDLSDALNNKH